MPNSSALSIKARRPFLGFERERETYHRVKSELLDESEGRYVVIVGDEMIGPFNNFGRAEDEGYHRFGLGPLYIKQILREESTVQVTRVITP